MTLLAFFTRLYRIGQSNIVTWDEAQYRSLQLCPRVQPPANHFSFGKFGSHYLKREFYFDVSSHPLSIWNCDVDVDRCIHRWERCWLVFLDILLATTDLLSSNRERFIPKSSTMSSCVFSTRFSEFFVFPWCSTLPEHSSSQTKLSISLPSWSFVVSTRIKYLEADVLENSYATISRFILLDSMLLFFTATTMFCLAKFHQHRREEFEPMWWIWLCATGASIGCVCRCLPLTKFK